MAKHLSTFLAIFWGGVIIGFTLQEGSQSSELSQGLTTVLYSYFSQFSLFNRLFDFSLFHTTVRAMAHVFNYLVFGVLTTNALKYYKDLNFKTLFGLIIFGALFGFLDENLQRLVPGRGFAWFDVLLDSLGFVFGVLIYQLSQNFIKLLKN